MFSYDKVKDKPELFLAMTGLTCDEFEQLLPNFEKAWQMYIQKEYINREGRQRQYGGGQHETTLVSIEDKLLFILYYVKVYQLQEILAFEFGMTQSVANKWIQILLGVLRDALDISGYLAERDPQQLANVLDNEGESDYAIDGTDREIQRPIDSSEQQKYYSGKKKKHTIKNIIIGDIDTQEVVYLSQTYEGKKHDKKIVDEENPTFPEDINLFKDTGFQGYEPENIVSFQPQKKTKGKELTQKEKNNNKLISKIRVAIEHIISGVKRCRIVKDIFRNTKEGLEDLVIEIACGLHNLRSWYRYT
jgi:hypothetical protein